MRNASKSVPLGDLIAALYDEASRVTPDVRTREILTYLALMDLQNRSAVKALDLQTDGRPTAA